MLSILIPIYNFDVRNLVKEFYEQAKACSTDFEILCYDDASKAEYKLLNRDITQYEKVIYFELKENAGRSKIRNLLANNAKYNFLLFLDCDSKIISADYLKKYIQHTNDKTIVFGGRSYEENPPYDKNKFLRWYYGTKRESIPLKTRCKKPYKYLMTNNFLIPAPIYSSIKMNENINGYGHEDTLFAQELKRRKISVIHINNPLCHIGLEDATEFLNKTKQGINNLAYLIKNKLIDNDIKIFRFYCLIEKLYLKSLIKFIFCRIERILLKKIFSHTPNLKYFDFYKLGYLVTVMDKEQKK